MPTTERAGCRRCGGVLPVAGRGPLPVYCSGRCRVAAHRERKAREALPVEMTRLRRWVRRDGKRPIRADSGRPASSTDPFTWATHPQAKRSRHGDGIGYMLDGGDGIVCIDLDHALDGGKLAPWAQAILARCPATFTEVSPSGTGLHIWGRARVRQGRVIRRPDGAHIEIYGRARHIAVTAERYKGAPVKLADVTELVRFLTPRD
jgi:primase-polymerase (primpol)-like protein